MALFNKKKCCTAAKSADFALLPNHVGIIMDGQRSLGQKAGLAPFCRT